MHAASREFVIRVNRIRIPIIRIVIVTARIIQAYPFWAYLLHVERAGAIGYFNALIEHVTERGKVWWLLTSPFYLQGGRVFKNAV